MESRAGSEFSGEEAVKGRERGPDETRVNVFATQVLSSCFPEAHGSHGSCRMRLIPERASYARDEILAAVFQPPPRAEPVLGRLSL